MPNHTRMKRIFLDGVLWLFLLQYGLMVLSLEPGFLDFDNLPDTNFTCHGKVIGGYYADVETNCQMFHVCTKGQAGESMDIRFLCLNGTVFDQETRVCERIDEVDCSKSEQYYSLNLELYQHAGSNSEDTPEVAQETEAPSMMAKQTTTAPVTTTTKRPTSPKPSHYFTTPRPVSTTSGISGHHFPVNAPDIRFNPEEINISLNAGAPPDIRTKHYQTHQSFVGDDSDEEQTVRLHNAERTRLSVGSNPKNIFAIHDSDKPEGSDISFGFPDEAFRSTEHSRQPQFLIQTNSFRHSQSFPPPSASHYQQQFRSTTPKHFRQEVSPSHTTSRTIYLSPVKAPSEHHHYLQRPRTEKTPQKVQIPIPVLPTLPPFTFSSPAPFSLHHHIESKRYTKDHPSAPRIIISASASVSDASGRRLNYSLGTIGAAHILDNPPSSYDEYKDSDVGLDPFYHDVPKIKRKRRSVDEKRLNPFEVIRNEKEAVEVLKFLFNWYQSHQATATVPSVTSPVSSDLIRTINNELAPAAENSVLKPESSEVYFSSSKEEKTTESLKNSELFQIHSKYNILNGKGFGEVRTEEVTSLADGGVTNVPALDTNSTTNESQLNSSIREVNLDDYVDDNYEPIIYKEYVETSSSRNLVEPIGAYELYKYVNLNNQLTTPSSLTAREDLLIPNTSEYNILSTPPATESPSTRPITQSSETTEVTSERTSPPLQNTRESDRHTEINVVSEVHEGPHIPSSTTSERTSTSSPGRRRGRGRQRNVDNHQEASFTSHQVNRLTSEPAKVGKRTRGRSRFRDSFSTTLPPVTHSTTEGPLQDTQLLKEEMSSTARVVTGHEESLQNAQFVKEEVSSTPSVVTSREGSLHDTQLLKEELSSTTNVVASREELTTESVNKAHEESTQVGETTEYVEKTQGITESKSETTEKYVVTTKPLGELLQTTDLESSSTTHITLPKEDTYSSTNRGHSFTSSVININDLLKKDWVSTTTELHQQTQSEPTQITSTTDTQNESRETTSSTDDPSYLVKLLRYFAGSDSIYAPATELPKADSYEPLTENYMSSVPYFVTPSSEESTTQETPTPSELKNNLLEKLSIVNQNLEEGLRHQTDDTTVTTPLINFEEKLSYGTTFEGTTEPVQGKNFSGTSESSRSSNKYHYGFYDDIFVVPELLEESKQLPKDLSNGTITETVSTEESTQVPSVEIQKSISLPVSVLDGPLYHINELLKTTTIPTTVPEPTSTTEFIASSTLLNTEPTTTILPEESTTSILPPFTANTPERVNSSHLFQVVLETSTPPPLVTTTTLPDPSSKRTRPPRQRQKAQHGRHRFNTELVSRKQSNFVENVTEAPLLKSASPTKTRSELTKVLLHTTPLSSGYTSGKVTKNYVFNCFGKETNKFYADPRDCRLFHYCTQGYSKNQLLDLKYVCDQKTYFDEDRLICTKVKPTKCK